MIFIHEEDGLEIRIPYRELMKKNEQEIIETLQMGIKIYKGFNADLDDDDSDGERYRSRNMDVVVLESSHRYKTVY